MAASCTRRAVLDDVERLALAFDAACRDAGVAYAFIGGMAVITWGQPRFTADVDTLVRLEEDRHEAFVAALGAHGLDVDGKAFTDAREDRTHVSVFDRRSTFHIDVKLARSRDETAQIEAARTVSLGSGSLRVARAEDTIAFKLLFGSPQDLQDARSIVWRQGDALDHARLRKLAANLGVEGRLDALLSDAER